MAISRNSLTCYLSSSIAADGEHGESHSMSDAAFFIDIVLTCISKKLNVSDHKVSKWVNLVYLCLLSSVHANT